MYGVEFGVAVVVQLEWATSPPHRLQTKQNNKTLEAKIQNYNFLVFSNVIVSKYAIQKMS